MMLRLLLVLADGVAAVLVFLAVSVVRFDTDPNAVWSVGIDPGPAALLFAAMWVGVFWGMGLYRLHVRWSLLADARDIGRGTLIAVAVTLASLFVLHQDDVSRVLLAMLFVVQPLVVLIGRAALRGWFAARRRMGRDTSYMLVVGTGPLAQAFADRVEEHHALGIKVIGHLDTADDAGGARAEPALSRPVLGQVDDIAQLFRERIVDEVAVCLPASAARYLDPVITIAADEGKTVRVPRDPTEGVLAGALQEEFDGFLVQSVVHDGQREVERAIKRVIDVLGSAVGLAALSPLLLVVGAALWLRDGSPILFRQTRIGRHGRPFTILKFRSMEPDAELRLAELAHRNEINGPAFKIHDDPRITRLGVTLRRTSLDELPQLWNVLVGDMSLVGPRPALPSEVAVYDIWHRRRLSVRPGLTGLWQVQARLDPDFDERAELDLRYIDQWSIWTDFGILARTVPAVFTRHGR